MKKLQLEQVQPDMGSSFTILNPHLSTTFLWHLHPEYEIVYVESPGGPRHVGNHISRYEGSDLVFIGPNIPHLNFDYGVHAGCQQVVIQMKENFLGEAFFNNPEIAAIKQLFKRASHGIAFYGDTRAKAAAALKQLQSLNRFDQLLSLLSIFQLLATSTEAEILNPAPAANKAFEKQQKRMDFIYKYVEQHYHEKPDVNHIAQQVNLSTAAFCRYFKKQTRLTFTDFINQYRIGEAKNLLLQHKTITEACYATGFEQLSYFNKIFKKLTGENPSAFKKRNAG
ncbi:AraC-like DNA-binding protein [Mucilaginibacter frigoritolerans]|uniref:AraC-like DNA-binding protein n=1 Tax=Mucilaginibacter frigoritolerans TaxID=652788 RepID=A0A562TKY9_9SPHI|nr:AraC family transcriptional regulator [Mucilaginibacter frigoritolerans]TWI94033.1 AraC-like DNA-binding protein [Mucilaginibacter frigoritolerans]